MIRRLSISVAVLVCAFSISAQPQEPARTTAAKPTADAKTAAELEAQRLITERRANAQSLLMSLAADATSFTDQNLRARTQARIADMLWEADRDRARALFRKAWDAAEIADEQGRQRVEEEIRQQQSKSGGGGYVVGSPPETRNEVLRLAAKRDRLLGEEFLGKLKEQEVAATRNKRPGSEGDSAVGQRLGLARQLLAAGDTERALQFADPVLGTVSMQTLDFLSWLREKDPVPADQRYAGLLSVASVSPQSDSNTASLLSSYIFTPHLYVTFVGNGASTSSTAARSAPPQMSPELRAAFFRATADILLRPLPQPGTDQASTATITRYYVLKRMMPLFEQGAAPESLAGLRAQLEALSSMVSENQRQSQEESVREGIQPRRAAENQEQTILDNVDRAKTSAQRDQLYFQLARLRAESGDLKARDAADKIEDSEMRQAVRAYIDSSLTVKALDKKDPEQALELARTGELSHLLRAWTMSRAARLLAKDDRERALQILDDATTEARRMDTSDPDRPRALLAIASVLLAIDPARGWDAASDAVKAANAAEGFTGADGQISFRIITKTSRSIHENSVNEFDVADIFRALAKEDYDRSVELARIFQREAPRAHAVMAIAQTAMAAK